ncbi:MAG: FliM/FliN family flagellar motor switch protein [Hyphomicrobium aestuarii]|nr:FliM/FliN family flagellar motor switch protein [Hyphomicrobium aestuarii]
MTADDRSETAHKLDSVVESIAQMRSAAEGSLGDPLRGASDDWGARGHEAIMRIPVSVQIVLGAVRIPVSKLMGMTRGSIIPLDRKIGDLVDVVVNDRIVARGEVVVIDEATDKFGVAVREVVQFSEDF